ncbi:MAG TPA: DUF882 domain-containing protein [Polyangia bacterium]|nr:DUF882 domain-containing protein [Polyangia bacterium]
MPIVLLYIVLSMVHAPALASSSSPLNLTFLNRHESTEVELYDPKGGERPLALKQLKHFVRCWRTQREKPMDPRLLQIISQVSHHFGDAEIQVVSGYRARPYGVPHSRHFQGRAMDIRIAGVPARVVREYVWQNFRGVGVGYYPEQQFVHVDVRDLDTGWVDHAKTGESARHVKYFVRGKNDPAPTALPAYAAAPMTPALVFALQ